MRFRYIRRVLGNRHGPWVLAAALLAAMVAAPFAGAFGEGGNVRGGARNPSPNPSRAYSKETQIIANVSTYGTRQSNKSDNGGGAVYGCRSKAGGTAKGFEPCIRANNLSDGLAFEFNSTATNATQVGSITATNPNAAPFTTNAHGVATGLNADQVDGKSASDITTAAVTAAQAGTKFASVNGADGALSPNNRGAKAAARTAAGTYTVQFDADVSKCARTATASGATPATVTTELAAPDTVTVHTFDLPAATAGDHSFSLVVTC
jgi:hypothetical protein